MKLDKKNAKKLAVIGSMTLVTAVVFLSVFHALLENPLLLASFASSVFVILAVREIHYPPTKVVVGSHLIAAIIGFALSFIKMSYYPTFMQSFFFPLNGALAVAIVAVLMVVFKVQHAPAASTALSFSYNLSGASSLMTFLTVLLMIGAIGLVKWAWVSLSKIVKELQDDMEWVERRIVKGVKNEVDFVEKELLARKK